MTVNRLVLVLLICQLSCSVKQGLKPERIKYEQQMEAILTYFNSLHSECEPKCEFYVNPDFTFIYDKQAQPIWIDVDEIVNEPFSIQPLQVTHDFGQLLFYKHRDDHFKFSPIIVAKNGRELAFFVKPPNTYLHFVQFSRIGSELVVTSNSITD